MLRSTLFRGVRGASTLIPSTRITPALTTIRHYAANPKPADPHHPPAESHGHAAAAGHHHDSHGATAHHDEHHHDDHGHHKHIDLSDGPYGVLFGEVYEGRRKIPAWEWIYYAGVGASIVVLYFVFKDFDERKIETWARKTYLQAKAEAEASTSGLQQLKDNKKQEE